jgi:hypothetical protein
MLNPHSHNNSKIELIKILIASRSRSRPKNFQPGRSISVAIQKKISIAIGDRPRTASSKPHITFNTHSKELLAAKNVS